MKFGINGQEANNKYRVGVGQYAFEVLKELAKLELSKQQFTVFLSEDPREDLPVVNDGWKYEVFGPKPKWTLWSLQKRLFALKMKSNSPDVFFTPTHYTPLLMPCPSVISIMDMSFETLPEFFKKSDLYQLKYWTKLSAIQAKKIITISEFSKREICRIYGFPEDKVVVTTLGYDKERFKKSVNSDHEEIKKALHSLKISGEYLLFLGTLQPKKNLVRLIEAMSQLKDRNLKLVVVGMVNEGRGGWMNKDIFASVTKLGLKDRVIFTGYIPDEQVPLLMAGAKAYVLPSLYEGFGIPAVEAMALGKPIIVSQVASLPEVCGTGAIYIENPFDVTSIKQSLEQFLEMSESEIQTRIQFGLEWVKRYNWEDTARKTLEVLYDVAKG